MILGRPTRPKELAGFSHHTLGRIEVVAELMQRRADLKRPRPF